MTIIEKLQQVKEMTIQLLFARLNLFKNYYKMMAIDLS